MDIKFVAVLIITLSTIAILPYFWYANNKDGGDDNAIYQGQGPVLVSFAAPLPNCKDNQGQKIMIDLGANCGNSFYALQKNHGPFNQSYLWELNPFLFPHLEKLVQSNENVTFIPYGAWNKEEEITLDIIGNFLDKCDLSESLWDGTTFVETKYTDKKHQWNNRYNSTVKASTKIFVDWYQQNICQQDEVTLKIDIEKAEFVVLSHFISAGLLCHPKKLLFEFHKMRVVPNITQTKPEIKQKSDVQNQELKQKCFTSGFISTLELLMEFCEEQPKVYQWW